MYVKGADLEHVSTTFYQRPNAELCCVAPIQWSRRIGCFCDLFFKIEPTLWRPLELSRDGECPMERSARFADFITA